ncbi:MAG: RraA family protein [Terriglobia bacterium]
MNQHRAGQIEEELMKAGTAILSDAMGKTGAMDHDMRCWSAQCLMAGKAFTAKVHPADILMVGIALSHCPKDKVLVIDGQGELNTALWGGATTIAAGLKGLAGVVIDGAIRDLREIQREQLPVFARSVVPNAGGAEYPGEINVPIECGGVVVQPDDWVVGDEDGVVVVPAASLDGVMESARKLLLVEKAIYEEVRQGKDVATLLHYHELLEQKSKKSLLPQMRFLERKD